MAVLDPVTGLTLVAESKALQLITLVPSQRIKGTLLPLDHGYKLTDRVADALVFSERLGSKELSYYGSDSSFFNYIKTLPLVTPEPGTFFDFCVSSPVNVIVADSHRLKPTTIPLSFGYKLTDRRATADLFTISKGLDSGGTRVPVQYWG